MPDTLIDRLESAGEGSRELDAEIWCVELRKENVDLDGYGLAHGWHFERVPDERQPGRVQTYAVKGEDRLQRANRPAPSFTTSLDAAIALVTRLLPGWAWKVGTCCVSDDAWIVPDFNHPVHGDRLKEQFGHIQSGSIWDTGIDIDLRPSGRPAIALCIALLTALKALEAKDTTSGRGT